MGTSRNYIASVKNQPQWGKLSNTVTRNCDGDDIDPESAEKILSLYFQVTTGGEDAVTDVDNHIVPDIVTQPDRPIPNPPGVQGAGTSTPTWSSTTGNGGQQSGGSSSGGRPRTGRKIGKAGRKTASRLGGFFGSVASEGVRQAFARIGLEINGKTINDAISYLLDYCTGPATNLDETAAKAASNQLLDELVAGATNLAEMEALLQQNVNDRGIDTLLIRYFGYYTFEHLYQMFEAKLIKEKGKENCSSLFGGIKEFIFQCLEGINLDTPLQNINWNSPAANTIINQIYTKTLNYFRFYEG